MQVFLQFYVLFVISGILLLNPVKAILQSNLLKIVLVLIAYSGIVRIAATLYPAFSDFFSTSVFVAHLLFTPGAYLYLRNLVFSRALDKSDRIHLLPFVMFCIGSLVSYSINGTNNFWLSSNWISSDNFFDRSTALLNAVLFVLTAFYFGLSLLTIKHKTASMTGVQAVGQGNSENSVGNSASDPFSETAINSQRHTLLNNEKVNQIDDVIIRFLQEKKPFLQQRYSLKALSEDTQIPLHLLSAYINKHCGKNFNDFINEYRVEYCKEKILNQECRNKKLEAVAEESGFNNRNTFAIAFKKVTGLNPSQFLKQVKSGADDYPEVYQKGSLSFPNNVYCEV